MAGNNIVLIIHACTNDVMNTRLEELLEKYRKMIQRYKCKTNKIIIKMIPRLPNKSYEERLKELNLFIL